MSSPGVPWRSRLYKPRVPATWWLDRRTYTAFVLRELTSVFVAWTVVYLLVLVRAVAGGGAEYERFLDWSAAPWLIALNLVALAFLLYHAITFINLTPQAMVVKIRRRCVPGRVMLGSLYAGWLVVSVFLAWLVLR